MEKPSFCRNGVLRLPIGFRFHPTDEELVDHYLKRKALNLPLPASIIPEFHAFRVNPWDLPGDLKEKRYFFSNRKWKGRKCNRLTGCGYWKVTGRDIEIVAPGSDRVVGLKKSLAFHGEKGLRGTKTPWVMHEYRLAGSQTNPNPNPSQELVMEDWVVCCIFQKERKSRSLRVVARPNSSCCYKAGNMNASRPCEIDFRRVVEDGSDLGPPQPSSCSSGSAEVSSNRMYQEETSSPINFSSHS